MNLIIDFYKELDTINLIVFWGIILVIFLLLIFAIIITNKNKRLRRIIITKEQEIEKKDDELAIKQNLIDEKEKVVINKTENKDIYVARPIKEEITVNKENTDIYFTPPIEDNLDEEISIKENNDEETKKENITNKDIIINKTENSNIYIKTPIKEKEVIIEKKEDTKKQEEDLPIKEETFIAEEHVKQNKEIIIPREPYQRNVLREMSQSQTTSPIGITKKEPNPQKEILNREVTRTKVQDIEILEDSLPTETYHNNYQEEMDNSRKMINKIYEEENKAMKEAKKVEKNNYLQELSKKLSDSSKDDIQRTAYELKQEEDAIISYEELMKKKDTLKIEDEEDAIISIEELKRRKQEEERIYNITKEEEDNKFINELKDFRSDL